MTTARFPHSSSSRTSFLPWALGSVAACIAGLSCGGGSGTPLPALPASTSHLSVSPASASLTLPVPTGITASEIAANGGYYPPPYSGTITVNITKDSTITGPVALSVSGLPGNVRAQFSQASITGTSAELSIQAGYPASSDPTFTQQVYPMQGTYTLTLNASGSSNTATAPLTLVLGPEKPDFALGLIKSDGSALVNPTVISLLGSQPVTEYFAPYDVAMTDLAPASPVTIGTRGLPTGLGATLPGPGTLDYVMSMVLTPASSLPASMYAFDLTASLGALTRSMPLVVAYSQAPFFIHPFQTSSPISVRQNGTLTFPLYLGHNDAYYGSVTPTDGTDPGYAGGTTLSVASVQPAGPTVSFGATQPVGQASVPLTITTGNAAPGAYSVQLQATRTRADGTSVPASFTLPLVVTSATGAATTWIQTVEWGQSVLMPGLTLIAGKPALLRVQVLADRPNQAAPATLTATVGGTVYPLAGPALLPTAVIEGDLPGAGHSSGSSYTAILPASAVTAGMQVTLQIGSLSPLVITPQVQTGNALNTTLVPIVQAGLQPLLPADAAITKALLAFWPLQSVNLYHRAAYTTSTVIPLPTKNSNGNDTSGDGWSQIISELASLQIVDQATTNYYGFMQLSFPASWTGSSVVGLSYIGQGAGLGLDETTAAVFDDPSYDVGLDTAISIMVHEEGHAMNLNHAPAGGAADPQLNYPYYNAAMKQGAATGCWGYDPATLTAYDPASTFDIMSYAANNHWVSDWNYLAAMGWVGGAQGLASPAGAPGATPAAYDQWIVSGWIDPAGAVHLQPLVRATCLPKPPRPGAYHLRLQAGASLDIPFSADTLPDLPTGHRHFTFTVPASGEVLSAEVHSAGSRLFRRAGVRPLALRRAALQADADTGALVVREQSGSLHLEWEAAVHPWVNVIHEGARRTTLALHLTGGSADLPLDGLPEGGRFLLHYSDGLNTIVRATDR